MSPYYWLLYYLYYKFSGAHQKPTTDDKFDPRMAHEEHTLCKRLRAYERRLYKTFKEKPIEKSSLLILQAKNIDEPYVFKHVTKNKTRPLVIRGLLKGSKAVRNWGPEHFEKHYGNTKLLTLRKPDDKNNDAYTSFTESLDIQNLTLKDSIRAMQDGSETLYVNNVTQIFADNPQLVKDLELDRIKHIDKSINSKNWLKINLFMGGPGTGSSLHCAVGGNFFFNVYGRKRWILIDPKYAPYLKSTPSKKFEFVISGWDVGNPSEILKKIPKFEVTLDPGDVLYNPPWWWHQVTNISDFTIGCAIRDHSAYWQSFKNNLMFMCMSPYPLYINPLALWLVNKIRGRDYLLNKSMRSERYVISNLTKLEVEEPEAVSP